MIAREYCKVTWKYCPSLKRENNSDQSNFGLEFCAAVGQFFDLGCSRISREFLWCTRLYTLVVNTSIEDGFWGCRQEC